MMVYWEDLRDRLDPVLPRRFRRRRARRMWPMLLAGLGVLLSVFGVSQAISRARHHGTMQQVKESWETASAAHQGEMTMGETPPRSTPMGEMGASDVG